MLEHCTCSSDVCAGSYALLILWRWIHSISNEPWWWWVSICCHLELRKVLWFYVETISMQLAFALLIFICIHVCDGCCFYINLFQFNKNAGAILFKDYLLSIVNVIPDIMLQLDRCCKIFDWSISCWEHSHSYNPQARSYDWDRRDAHWTCIVLHFYMYCFMFPPSRPWWWLVTVKSTKF